MVVIKRLSWIVLVVLLSIFWAMPALAMDKQPAVDNRYIDFGDNVIKVDGVAYLPLKDIMDCLGINVIWCADDQDKILVAADNGHYQITLSFDAQTGVAYAGTIDENVTYLVQLKDGRAYFPIEFYEQILNREVHYVANMGRINIVDPNPKWQEVIAATDGQPAIYSNFNPRLKNLATYSVEVASRSANAAQESEAEIAAEVSAVAPTSVNGIPIDTEKMVWPTTATRISSPYGKRGRGFHTGVDIDGDTGDPVYAAWTGKVIRAGWSGGYGYCVDIEHADGSITRYAHMQTILTQTGVIVNRGEQIGTVGATGNASGDHLHFEVRKAKATYSPLDYISTSRMVG